ncbi:hypothetical protein [Streptomyces sp. NBC_01233]|uniref:hypothetical protein n=1 Tax=Streptomyces sp. NBC_01233 TaxID=2903787 RepID=UPI002E15CC89|nr:hypothetical protein OG332_18225 [Streptomyces sp. NBC_01233]
MKPLTAPETAPERFGDVRVLWDALTRQIAADGFMVMGASGLPVPHPALRYFTALHSAMQDLEAGHDPGSMDGALEQMQQLARQALSEYDAENF